jgi:hypothetical protein
MEAVDQLLFGYRDGHQLLAASRTISPRQQRELLPHVDASFERSDARQLVGIGVPALDAYLLGAIWPAPERPRPGAVWAHALLIGTDQLARLPLLGLLTLLERPRDDHLERYSRRLPWPALPREGARLAPFSRALASPRELCLRYSTRRQALNAWRSASVRARVHGRARRIAFRWPQTSAASWGRRARS